MKAHKLALSLAVCLGSGLWMSLPATVLAAGNVDTVSGDASITSPGGKPKAVSKGDRIVAGDTISTGANAAVLITTDDSGVLAVRPSSRLTIEAYKVNGNDQDSVVLNLLRGSLRSITGWISKTAPKNYKVTTSTATIGIRGTDHEVSIGEVVEGAAGNKDDSEGTWNQVTEGATTLANTAGELVQQAGTPSAIGRVSAAGLPPVFAAIAPPTLFRPQATDTRTIELKKDAQTNQQQRLDTRKSQVAVSGGSTGQGGTQVSTQCAPDSPAQQKLDELIRAYEQGDIAFFQNRISPSMVGYGALINDLQTSSNAQRQTRIQIKDRVMQCGPDVSSITFNWEKTFLDAVTFRPGIVRGSTSVLITGLSGSQWQVAGMAGSSPFVSTSGDAGTDGVVSVSVPSIVYGNNNSGCSAQQYSGTIIASQTGPALAYTIQQITTPATSCNVVLQSPGTNACQLTISGLPNGPTVVQGNFATFNSALTTCSLSYSSSPPTNVDVGGFTLPLSVLSSPVAYSGPPGSSIPLSAPVVFSGSRVVSVQSFVTAKYQVQTPIRSCTGGSFQLPPSNLPPVCVATPSTLPVTIEVRDADVTAPNLQVVVSSTIGDLETFTLPRVSAGVYRLNALPIARGGSAVVQGNGRIDLPYLQFAESPVTLTINYTDARSSTGTNIMRQTRLTLIP